VLSSPVGPLSEEDCNQTKRLWQCLRMKVELNKGNYQRYSRMERARIGNYTVAHGTSAALNHFINEFPGLTILSSAGIIGVDDDISSTFIHCTSGNNIGPLFILTNFASEFRAVNDIGRSTCFAVIFCSLHFLLIANNFLHSLSIV